MIPDAKVECYRNTKEHGEPCNAHIQCDVVGECHLPVHAFVFGLRACKTHPKPGDVTLRVGRRNP